MCTRACVCVWVGVCVCVCVWTPANKRARRAQINFSVFDISNHCLLPIVLFKICFCTKKPNSTKNQAALSFKFYRVSSQLTQRERGLKICEYFTLKPPRGERSHMETLCECEYKESAGKSKKFSQFSGLCKRAQYQDIECVCV